MIKRKYLDDEENHYVVRKSPQYVVFVSLRGFLFASRGYFSDNGCLSGASQAAEGRSISCVPRSVIRYNNCVPGYRGRT